MISFSVRLLINNEVAHKARERMINYINVFELRNIEEYLYKSTF